MLSLDEKISPKNVLHYVLSVNNNPDDPEPAKAKHKL